MTSFSSLDLEFLRRSLGRDLTKIDLKTFEKILAPVLDQRRAYPTDAVQQLNEIDKNIFFEELMLLKSGKWKTSGMILRECALNGFFPERLDFIFQFTPTKKLVNLFNEIELQKFTELNISTKIHTSDFPKAKDGMVLVVASPPKTFIRQRVKPNQTIGWIQCPKPGRSFYSDKKLKQCLSSENIISGVSVCVKEIELIRTLLMRIEPDTSLQVQFDPKMKKGDGVIFTESTSYIHVKQALKTMGLSYERIGTTSNKQSHIFMNKKGIEKKWPVSLFNISVHSQQITHLNEDMAQEDSEPRKPKNLSILNTVKEMIQQGKVGEISNLMNDLNESGPDLLFQHNDAFLARYPHQFRGIRFVADIVRKASEQGIVIQNILFQSTPNNAKFIQGQTIALKSFQLEKLTQKIVQDGEGHSLTIIGRKTIVKPPENAIDGDFISLLGTFKGELGHSLYAQICNKTNGHEPPGFDSTMELNINQTISQATSIGIIKACQSIEKGGLTMALLNFYQKLEKKFGIKMHISRKLNPEEILFGESFGSALVLVGEKDLMEFQRICMTHGIPCSTIGRIQDKQEICVNDILTLSEKFLKTHLKD